MNDCDGERSLEAHGGRYTLWTWPGRVRACMDAGRPYEQPLLEHIYQCGFEGLAVDVGANLGNHTLWFAAICRLQVLAFEPLWHEQLSRSVSRNSHVAAQINVEPVALGAPGDEHVFHTGRGRMRRKPNDTPPLRTVTLDAYELDGVALIKLDVEGMEPAVLRGAQDTISRCNPVIFSEEWGDDERRAAARVLRPLGYTRTTSFLGKNQATRMARWEPENL